jgi:hypothetical protein
VYAIRTGAEMRAWKRRTWTPRPPGLGTEYDRNRTCVADNEVVRPRTHDVAISLKECVRDEVLVTLNCITSCPEPRHTSEDGTRILGEWMEWRQTVESD